MIPTGKKIRRVSLGVLSGTKNHRRIKTEKISPGLFWKNSYLFISINSINANSLYKVSSKHSPRVISAILRNVKARRHDG
jgi:hypothetical protein